MSDRRTRKPSYYIISEKIIRNFITKFLILLILLCCTHIITDTVVPKYAYFSYIQTEHVFVEENNYMGKYEYVGPMFHNVQKIDDIWDYCKYNFLYILHSDDLSEEGESPRFPYLFNMGLVVGLPRIRQIRVRDKQCTHKIDLDSIKMKKCYPVYSSRNSFKGTYKDVKYVADAIQIPKTFYTYEGGGFSVNLGHDFIENMNTLNNLMNAEWIDSATRLVVIEMNVYFDGIDFFHLIKLVFEIMPTGIVVPSVHIQWIPQNTFLTLDVLSMCAGGVFCLIAIYYTYVEITEIIWIGPKAYAGNVYNYIDFFFLTSAYAVFAYNVWHIFQIRSIQKAFLANRFRYINMDDLILGWKTYIQVLGVMNFMAWLKPMRFVSFHRSIQQVLSAVRVSFKSIVSLCLLCLIITGAFAQLGCIAFSQVHQEYTTEFASIIAQIRFLMTDISYTSLEDAHPDLAPFFFVVLVVATYCIILNLFKAIYLSAEEDVKRQLIVNDYKVIRMLLQGFKYYLCFWRKLSSEEIHTVEMRQEQDNLPDKDVNGKPKYIYQVEPLIKLREQLALESERCTRLEEILEVFVDTIENIEQLQKPKKVKKKHN